MLVTVIKLLRRLHTRGILWHSVYYAKKVASNSATCWTSGLRGATLTPSRNLRKRRSTNLFESSVSNVTFLTHISVVWLHWSSKRSPSLDARHPASKGLRPLNAVFDVRPRNSNMFQRTFQMRDQIAKRSLKLSFECF